MQVGIAVIADTTMLESYLKSIPRRLQAACTDQVKRSAEDARLRAPKDTTAMSESVYWIDATGKNNYNERSDAALSLNPRISERWGGPLGPVEQPPYPGATLAVAAPYAAIVNGGFAHDRNGQHIAGDPFFTETVALMREEFPRTCQEFLSGNFQPDQNAIQPDDNAGGSQAARNVVSDNRTDHRLRG